MTSQPISLLSYRFQSSSSRKEFEALRESWQKYLSRDFKSPEAARGSFEKEIDCLLRTLYYRGWKEYDEILTVYSLMDLYWEMKAYLPQGTFREHILKWERPLKKACLEVADRARKSSERFQTGESESCTEPPLEEFEGFLLLSELPSQEVSVQQRAEVSLAPKGPGEQVLQLAGSPQSQNRLQGWVLGTALSFLGLQPNSR